MTERDWAEDAPVFRIAGGLGLTFVNGRARTKLDLDIHVGYRKAFSGSGFLDFEGTYTFQSEPTYGGHFAAIGLGPGLDKGMWGIAWTPKLVLGGTWLGFAVGVRNTVRMPVLYQIFSFEMGHQYLRVGGLDEHDLRFQVGFDPARFLQVLGQGLAAASMVR